MSQENKRGKGVIAAVFTEGRGKEAVNILLELMEKVSESFWEIAEPQRLKGKERSKLRKYIVTVSAAVILLFLSTCVSLCSFSSDIPSAIYPVCIAVICSAGVISEDSLKKSNKDIFASAVCALCVSGALISCIFMEDGGLIYFLICTALFLGRMAMTGGRLDETIPVRVTAAAGSAVFAAFIIFFSHDGMEVKDVISLCFAAPVMTFLFCGFIRRDEDDENGVTVFDRNIHIACGIAAILYSFIGSIRDVNIFVFSAPMVISVIVTTSVAKAKGPLYGSVCGTICGLAQSFELMAEYGTLYSAVLGISGLFAGLLFEYSGTVAVMCSFCVACGYSLFTGGIGGFGTVAADTLAGLIIFFFISRFIPSAKKRQKMRISSCANVKGLSDAERAEALLNDRLKYKYRLRKLSDAFESLSGEFSALSDKMKRPGISQTSHIVSSCASRMCSDCSLSSMCWGKDYSSTSDITMKLAVKLLESGRIDKDDISEHFRNKCIKLEKMIEMINSRYTSLCAECFNNNRTQVLAGEYSTVSRLLKVTVDDIETDAVRNTKAEKRAAAVMAELEIPYACICSYGARTLMIDIAGVYPEKLPVSQKQISEAFEKRFSGVFEEPVFLQIGETGIMRLKRKRLVSMECAKASCAGAGENINGDTAGFFENEDDYFYALICDGMGRGREAALTSRLASIFIERLLTCSGEKCITLEMLNDFLLTKSDESFTTVDLLEVDMIRSEACFIKAGASSSYIVRGGRLYKISSRTPPAGIISRMTAEQTRLAVEKGDIIVMISDGIVDNKDMGAWLLELLSLGCEDDPPAALAKRILNEAKARNGRTDDMTVSVVKVKGA
ncbi:MAG: hypothetical protein E7665_00750 [Ruminococcaceae bacterium]|nr:hypothetical protein [Oscillospiraceae bacterium]